MLYQGKSAPNLQFPPGKAETPARLKETSMADQTAGPVEHIIPVECDLASLTVHLTLPFLKLKAGDRVLWQFFGLSDAWSPWIEFDVASHFLGPFTNLTQSGAAVWGICSDLQILGSGPFVYRAVIRKAQGTAWESAAAVINSPAGRLDIDSPETGTVRQFTVTQSSAEDALDVSPPGIFLQEGDTVEWKFQDIRNDLEAWRPQVSFRRYDGSGTVSNLSFGPFTSLTVGPDSIRGMGNNQIAGTYYFQVSITRLSDGSVLQMSSHDPAIDNRGGVGDPTSTGGGG
jgi:hypothetical protein